MKFRRLPPLHTLEAFEAAARGLSFKSAAAELHLTASAISHQIKALEHHLGFALFRRGNRSLELTDGGRDYLLVVRDTLARLRDGSQRVAQRHARTQLKISMGPFIGSEIILPALASFQAAHPDIAVHIETTLRPVDLLHEDLDIALRFGDGSWPKLTAVPLMRVAAVPVCAPSQVAPLADRGLDAISDMTLIHSSPMPQGWSDWAGLLGIKLSAAKNDLWLDSYLAILRAAEQGLGLAMGLVPMVNPWLQSGKLATPWPQYSAEIPQGYYLLHRDGDDSRPAICAFRDWLIGALGALQPGLASS